MRVKCVRQLVVRVTICAAVLAGLAAGCRKREDTASPDESAGAWKAKYESVAAKNEELQEQARQLEEQNTGLLAEIEGLKAKLDEAAEAAAALAQVTGLKRELAERDDALASLRQQLAELEPVTESGRGSAGQTAASAQLEQLRKKTSAVCEDLYATGARLYEADNYEDARRVFSPAAELGSTEPGLLFTLAYCYGRLGDDEAAARWYAKAVEAAEALPDRDARLLPKLYNNYGATLVALGKPEEAFTWYQKALEADDRYAPAYFNLGRLYAEHLNDTARAIDSYRGHIALGGSRSVAAREALAELLRDEAEPDDRPPAAAEGD